MSPETRLRDYLDEVSRYVFEVDEAKINTIAGLFFDAVSQGHVILAAGNGGSLATAMHWATDVEKCVQMALPFEKRHHPHVPRVRVIGENTSILTAHANDDEWPNALAWQVGAWGEPGSVLLLLSASGASVNLLTAAAAARKQGLTVAALVGRKGSRLAEMAHVVLEVGTDDTQVAEDAQSVICHALFRELRRQLVERAQAEEQPAG